MGPEGARLLWLWVMVSATTAYFMVQAKRSKTAFEALIGAWAGILISDGYGVYTSWPGERQTCLAHLIRAAKALKESPVRHIAACGSAAHRELKRLCRMSRILPTFGEIDALHARLCKFVNNYAGYKDAAGTFARRIARELPHLKTFLKHRGLVGPTNNHAERTLRHGVIWRKCSHGTTSEKGDRFVERALSIRHTCRLRKMSTFRLLVKIMHDHARSSNQDTAWTAA